jgi:hypothetical protein
MQAMAQAPEVQEQMAQMAAVMQNKQLMDRMQQLRVRIASQSFIPVFSSSSRTPLSALCTPLENAAARSRVTGL